MNQDFTVQKKNQYLSKEKISAEGFTWKKKILHKQWAKNKIPASWKFPPPHPPITFLMVRPLAVDGQQAMVL